MNNETFEKRLDELIQRGYQLIQKIPSVGLIRASYHIDLNQRITYSSWKLSCLNLLRSKFGASHAFYLNFKNAEKGNWTIHKQNFTDKIDICQEKVAAFYATLLYIKEEVQIGLIEDAQHLYESNLFSNLLEQAFELLEKDYLIAATIYSRLIIENFINDLCRIKCITLEDGKNYFAEKITRLRKEGVFDLPTERILQSIYDVGTYATHGKEEFKTYDKEKIKYNLEFIQNRMLIIK